MSPQLIIINAIANMIIIIIIVLVIIVENMENVF